MAGPIRQPIDLEKFGKYVDEHVPEIKTPLEVKQFGYGQSNPTYLLQSPDGSKYVMRKKPPGKLLSKTAHQVDREYRIIKSLENTDVPVPRAYCLCEDDSIIGTPFYIMSYLDGRIFPDPSFPGVSAEHRTLMWKSAVETLGKFHRVDPKSVGMESFGRPNNFYNRQLKTFATISVVQSQIEDVDSGEPVGKIPHYDEIVEFFGQPASQPYDRGTFVHGDYKIDNVVFHKTEPYVIGVLDWEMATIGHPLSDVSNLFSPFATANNELALKSGRASPAFVPGKTPGLPSQQQCLDWYHAVVNYRFPPKEIAWGEAFNLYRGCIIVQGIKARLARRQASSEKARDYAVQMEPMGEMAWEFVKHSQRLAEQESRQAKL